MNGLATVRPIYRHALLARCGAESIAKGPKLSVDDKVDKHFTGAKEHWRASYEKIVAKAEKFGADGVTIDPAAAYVSLTRKGKKFAIVATTKDRMDVGIKLKGAPHAVERKYVFGTLQASTWETDDNDTIQSALMSAYWAAFAKAGDPNGGARPHWPKYDPSADEILDFTNDGPLVTKPPRRAAMDVLADIAQ